MKPAHYQAVVIGGGIVGAGIFRDLALHGVNTLLIDKKDFSSQTSGSSSKMLHGGIRYLENMDFALVFEALHEKNLWLKLMPHLAHEVPFYLPVFKDAKRPLWMIRLGMFLYDFLSSFENSPHKIRGRRKVLAEIPDLRSEGLSGAGVYYDGIMDDAKITLEVIFDALQEKCAQAMTYTEVTTVTKVHGKNIIHCKNSLTQKEFTVTCDQVVFALGPFTDRFLAKIPMYNWQNVLLPSKGSHLWISAKDLPLKHPIVMTTKDDRVIFVIPHDEEILVGTTEVPFNGDYFDVVVNDSEIDYLLKALNEYFPKLSLNRNHILSTFSGIRPLVQEEGGADRGKTSREHKIFQPMSDTYVIAGGKYTTFRVMGQDITREICHKHGRGYNENYSIQYLRQKSVIIPFEWHVPTREELIRICETEAPKTFQDLVVRRLSIPGRKIWDLRADGVDFNQYFLGHLDVLKKYLVISEEDIKSFK
ncbi:MAG: glycerol-3-phosphate dehydrogenase/oxidase [Bacteriovorax sp.]|jgi:glycerol-3-phosphate dehydrogenase